MPSDVVVIGAGIVGCAVARALAPDHRVLVLDRADVAAGATGRAAGLITPAAAYADLPAVARYADAFVRAYHRHRGVQFISRASVEPVPAGDAALAKRRVERLAADGAPVSFLDPDAAAAAHPHLDLDGFDGVVRFDRAGYLDPWTYAHALLADAHSYGADLRTGIEVTDLRTADGAIVGVETDLTTFHADAVVVAAGWRTPTLLDDTFDGDVPLQPYRSQCAIVDVAADVRDCAMGVAPDGRYFRPTVDGNLLVGGRAETVDDPANADPTVDDDFLADAADLADRLLRTPGSPTAVEGWAGVDVATPDARPIVDAPAGPTGLLVATGFTGLGVSFAPVAAALVRSLILGEEGLPRGPFALGRFDSPEKYPFLEEP